MMKVAVDSLMPFQILDAVAPHTISNFSALTSLIRCAGTIDCKYCIDSHWFRFVILDSSQVFHGKRGRFGSSSECAIRHVGSHYLAGPPSDFLKELTPRDLSATAHTSFSTKQNCRNDKELPEFETDFAKSNNKVENKPNQL